MPGKAQPLASNFAIVDAKGFPTPYFIRWAQERQIDITAGITGQQAQDLIDEWAADRQVNTSGGLAGGGPLAADLNLHLTDTGVSAGTYGDATHVARVTVDAKGRVTAASQVPISGGGGGLEAYYNFSNTSTSVGSAPTSTTAVISANIPADTVDRLFMVNGNITWTRSHSMRGSICLDGSGVFQWPVDVSGNHGISSIESGDGLYLLAFSGVIIAIPGDGAAHTIDLCYEASGSTGGFTLESRHIVAVKIG